MQKFFRTLGILLGLPLTYILISNLTEVFYGVYLMYRYDLSCSLDTYQTIKLSLANNKYSIALISNIAMLLVMSIIFLPFNQKLLDRCNFKKLKLDKITNITLLTVGLSIVTLSLPGLLTIFCSNYTDIHNTIFQAHSSVLKLIFIIVLAPIFEEIFFRGVVFGFFKKNYNIIIAVIVQALLFAIAHGDTFQVSYIFLLGILLALIYQYSNSIWGPIISHIIFNLLQCLILPDLMDIFPHINIALIIVAILCITFSSIKILKKPSTYIM